MWSLHVPPFSLRTVVSPAFGKHARLMLPMLAPDTLGKEIVNPKSFTH